ncbi:peptide deformylase [Ureaplasma ceti]|uniref:Peptide deformylase n=1 Tax=Ureaplasma ceti TaxID=3119530 RepID=A0ABP9UAL3_9BACT
MDWIVTDDDARIRTQCADLEFPITKEDRVEMEKMVSYIDNCYYGKDEKYHIRAGVAIAAIQIGYLKRVTYLHFDDEHNVERHWFLANPTIVETSYDKQYLHGGEGCLSVPEDHEGIVPRASRIKVEAYDLLNNRPIKIEAEGYAAIVLQHEIDHLSGKLYYDRINVFNPQFADENWKKI